MKDEGCKDKNELLRHPLFHSHSLTSLPHLPAFPLTLLLSLYPSSFILSPCLPSLASLELVPYIDDRGQLPAQFQGKVGVYAIFDQAHVLQYIGYSRDIF